MECPACGKALSKMMAGDIELDACKEGCGGVWFDRGELEKFDEPHEFPAHPILELAKRTESIRVDPKKIKRCPCCPDENLVKQFLDIKNEVQIDVCWNCGGVWLDPGEINTVRGQYATYAERSIAVNGYIEEQLRHTEEEMDQETEQAVARYDAETRDSSHAALHALKVLLGLERDILE